MQDEVDEDDVGKVEDSSPKHSNHITIGSGLNGAAIERIDVAITDPFGRIHQSVINLQLETRDYVIAIELSSETILVLEKGNGDDRVHVKQNHSQQEGIKHSPNISTDGLQEKGHQADLGNKIQQRRCIPIFATVESKKTINGEHRDQEGDMREVT